MWNYAPWQGRYLPSPLAPRERLRAYATWCNAVEGNTTFYATPALGTVRSWAAQTSPDFRFILKLPKPLTHESRLTDTGGTLRTFLAAIEPLGTRAHTLWIQLPPSFSPGDLGALASFLRLLPRGYRYAVEVRHRAFFQDPRRRAATGARARAAAAEWVTFDTTVLFASPPATAAEREAWEASPACPAVRGHLPRIPSSAISAGMMLYAQLRGGPLARHGGRLAAGRPLPDGLHPHAGQRQRARAGPPVPRRRPGPAARRRAAPRAAALRPADALLSLGRAPRLGHRSGSGAART